jgi:hypothetical protein
LLRYYINNVINKNLNKKPDSYESGFSK